MKTEIDYIIKILKNNISEKNEFSEQEDMDTGSDFSGGDVGGESPDYPSVTKWESGVTRGPANQIGLTKWRDIVSINRGKANTLL